jgi:6-phosphofructokinase 1
VVAVSEGIHNEAGQLIAELFIKEVDSHGNKQLSGSGALGDYLVSELKTRLADKGKLRMRADTFGYLQRSFVGCRSEVDAAEARECGATGIRMATEAGRNGSVVMLRSEPYKITFDLTDLGNVAQKTKLMAPNYFNEAGNDVTADFIAYAKPLVGQLPPIALLGNKAVKL